MKLSTILFLLALFFERNTFAKFYPDDPVKFQSKIKSHVAHHVEKSPDIYFLADFHDVDQSNYLSPIIKELTEQDADIDCLFLEMPRKYMKRALENYSATGNYNYISESTTYIHKKYGTETNKNKELQRQTLLELSKQLKLSVFAVDELPSLTTMHVMKDMFRKAIQNKSNSQYDFSLDYQKYYYGYKRNKLMAYAINDLLINKCTKGIALNGASHLSGQKKIKSFDVLYKPLQLVLKSTYGRSFRVLKTNN